MSISLLIAVKLVLQMHFVIQQDKPNNFPGQNQHLYSCPNTHCMPYSLIYYWSLFKLVYIKVCVFLLMKEDINRLIEEGQLDLKLNELDKLERATKDSPDPAWSVNRFENT